MALLVEEVLSVMASVQILLYVVPNGDGGEFGCFFFIGAKQRFAGFYFLSFLATI